MATTVEQRQRQLTPGALITLYELDLTSQGGTILYFHDGISQGNDQIAFKGNVYTPYPIKAEGFETTTKGTLPRPKLSVSNIGSAVSSLLRLYGDFVGCTITRRRTFAVYIGGGSEADNTKEFTPDIFVVQQKLTETNTSCTFELATRWDAEGILLPRRQILANACLWTYRGPDCFGGNEEFITDNGPKRFKDAVAQSCKVLTADGFEDAEVKYFGMKKTVRITFRPANLILSSCVIIPSRTEYRRTVTVTPTHRWMLLNGSTDNLSEGDVVLSNAAFIERDNDQYNDGFQHGLVFGDGTVRKWIQHKGCFSHEISLYGRAGDHTGYFDRITWQPSAAAKGFDYAGTATVFADRNIKCELPSPDTGVEYLAGFVEGWIAADGDKGERYKSFRLRSQNKLAIEWLEKIAPLAGYIVIGKGTEANRITNYGVRSSPMLWLRLARRATSLWLVERIEQSTKQHVFCAVVPKAKAFTLAGGIYTHNCGYTGVPVTNSLGGQWGLDLGSDLGLWSAATTYGVRDYVYLLVNQIRTYYVSKGASNINFPPATNAAWWDADVCKKQLSDCKLHFGSTAPLPTSAFPATNKLS